VISGTCACCPFESQTAAVDAIRSVAALLSFLQLEGKVDWDSDLTRKLVSMLTLLLSENVMDCRGIVEVTGSAASPATGLGDTACSVTMHELLVASEVGVESRCEPLFVGLLNTCH
jgi:hypothetical protein